MRTEHNAWYLCQISLITYMYLHVARPWMGGREEFRYELAAPFCVHNMANAAIRCAVHALYKGVLYVQNAIRFHGTHTNESALTLLRNQWQFVFTVKGNNLMYKDVSKSSRTVLVKRSLLTLDVKFLPHLQSTPLLHEYSGPSVSAMIGSIPRSPFLELCQVPVAIPLESLHWCRIFDPSSEASAWGRGKSHRGPDRVSMGDGGSLSCSWAKTAKL